MVLGMVTGVQVQPINDSGHLHAQGVFERVTVMIVIGSIAQPVIRRHVQHLDRIGNHQRDDVDEGEIFEPGKCCDRYPKTDFAGEQSQLSVSFSWRPILVLSTV